MLKDKAKAIKRCAKPETVALVVVRDKAQNRVNIMPLGWKMWTSAQPRLIAFSVHREHHTHILLEQERECVLAWPSKEMLEGVLQCGAVSGANTDKLQLTGWETQPASQVSAPILIQAAVNLECKLTDQLATGDHTLFVAQILEGHLRPESYPLFTINEESIFGFVGQGSGYRFGCFS